MRILLTGATGFLGSRLAEALLTGDHEVIALKRRFSDTGRLESIADRISFVDLDRASVNEAIEKHLPVDLVLHAATCYGRNREPASEVFLANTLFPLQLLETAAKMRIPAFMNIGTGLHSRLNPYALSKAQFSEWGKLFAATSGIRFVDVAMEHIYGPGCGRDNFVTRLIVSCLMNVPEFPLTTGEQARDFLYIDDAVSALTLVIERMPTLSGNPLVLDLGSGETMTIRNLAESIRRMTGSVTTMCFAAVPHRSGEPMVSLANSAIIRGLGWTPRIPLDEGLARTIREESRRVGKTEQKG